MRRIIILLFILVFIFSVSAFAGEYVLVKGKGVEVCEAYGKNLNSFGYVMACEREINPVFKEFSKPEWKEMDILENLDLVIKLTRFLEGEDYPEEHPFWSPDAKLESFIKHNTKYGHLVIKLTQVDIDNDGKKENVIKYYDGKCGISSYYATPLLVLNDDKKEIEIKKTSSLLQKPEGVVGLIKMGKFTMRDVFVYKNKVYSDRWIDAGDEKWVLEVFVTESKKDGITKEVCKYRYSFEKQ